MIQLKHGLHTTSLEKVLLEISKTGRVRNGTFMLGRYDLVRFKDIVNHLDWELELS